MSADASPSRSEKRTPPRTVDYEDVDDVIGIASEMEDISRDRLSVEDLAAVARDLDIPDRFVQPAIVELARRREALLETERRRRLRKRWAIIGAAAIVTFVVLWALSGQAKLAKLVADAAQKRAQVVNVIERQHATEQQVRELPSGEQKAAELAGAENRVRIERKRYDEAASAYNAAVDSFPGGLWASLFGYPDALPLSNALVRF